MSVAWGTDLAAAICTRAQGPLFQMASQGSVVTVPSEVSQSSEEAPCGPPAGKRPRQDAGSVSYSTSEAAHSSSCTQEPSALEPSPGDLLQVFWGHGLWSRMQLLGEIAQGNWGMCAADNRDVDSQALQGSTRWITIVEDQRRPSFPSELNPVAGDVEVSPVEVELTIEEETGQTN